MFAAIHENHTLGLIMAGLSSLFWTITYALVILRGARDRTCGMPVVALAANLSWEVIFLVVTLSHGAYDERLAMLLPWTVLDVVIAWQCVRHGRRDAGHPLIARHFHACLAGIFALTAAVLFTFVHEMRDAVGWYAAFGQNLMMSILFVTTLLRRDSLRGQSIHLGLAKLLGTLFAFILAVFWSPPSLHEHWAELLPRRYTPVAPLIVVLYVGIFAFDVLYVALVHRRSREIGVDPWQWGPRAPASGAES